MALVFNRTQFVMLLIRKRRGYAIYGRSPETGWRLILWGSTGSNGSHVNSGQIWQFVAKVKIDGQWQLDLDQVIAEAKSTEILKKKKILQSNPTAADLSEVNEGRVPDHKRSFP